jgi:hypothetical protein
MLGTISPRERPTSDFINLIILVASSVKRLMFSSLSTNIVAISVLLKSWSYHRLSWKVDLFLSGVRY